LRNPTLNRLVNMMGHISAKNPCSGAYKDENIDGYRVVAYNHK